MLEKVLSPLIIPRLNAAPSKAHTKKTIDGLYLSATEKMAKISVPMMNPNWTAEVKYPKALSSSPKSVLNSGIMPFPANHIEVQKNCDKTIMGSISLDLCIGTIQIFLPI